jgi:hypothetical protein
LKERQEENTQIMKKPLPKHYVSNKKFYEALVDYRLQLKNARDHDKPLPQIPNYIGECLMLIAQRLSNKPNFIGYPHKDEMIADGIEVCVRYLEVFDPAKSTNPFAYFTQTIKMAFIRRIKSEKRQLYLKFKSSQNYNLTNQLNDNKFVIQDNEIVNSFIKDYEESIARKKEEAQGLEKALKDDTTKEAPSNH